MDKWDELVAKVSGCEDLPSMLALPTVDAVIDGNAVTIRLNAQDLDDLIRGLETYVDEYEAVDPDRAKTLAAQLRTVREALP